MKFHHAAALALVGWYLITPKVNRPEGRDASTLGSQNSMSDWVVVRSFDKAEDCEAERDKLHKLGDQNQRLLETLSARQVLEAEPDHGALARAKTDSDRRAECVASDDPRLKSK